MVRNGYVPARKILNTVGAMEVQVAKVRNGRIASIRRNKNGSVTADIHAGKNDRLVAVAHADR